jgi:hypothetical protein
MLEFFYIPISLYKPYMTTLSQPPVVKNLSWLSLLLAGIIAFILIRLLLLLDQPETRWWALVLPVFVNLVGFHFQRWLSPLLQIARRGFLIGSLIFVVFFYLLNLSDNIAAPDPFDFYLFWGYGRAAALGYDFYQPENAVQFVESLPYFETVRSSYISFYPPQSLLLFTPLGWFARIQDAYLAYLVVNGIVLIIIIFLLNQLFMEDWSVDSLLLSAVLVLALYQVFVTLSFGQTNCLILLFALLFWRDRDNPRAGIWMGFIIALKLNFAVLLLYALVRRKWSIFLSTAAFLIALTVLTMIAFGADRTLSFFNPQNSALITGYNLNMYTQNVNQSLLATILRLFGTENLSSSPLFNPLFIAGASILTLISAWLSFRQSEENSIWAFTLVILLTLLITPHSLMYYGVLLLIPIFLIWSAREKLPGRIWFALLTIMLLYALVGREGGELAFFANILAWLIVAGYCLRQITRQSEASPNQASKYE